jgi:pSer/pThr/pTyr-binding forkhead associated (FHA) protein
MYKISLEWFDGNRTHTRTILAEDKTKENGLITIGRDENQCDIFFPISETTVSRSHAAIFYDGKQKKLFVKNLTKNKTTPNPVIVDGKSVILEAAPLKIGSIIKLGKLSINVTQIEFTATGTEQVYGVRCINGHLLPYDHIGDFCPYCGVSLQASETVLMPRT